VSGTLHPHHVPSARTCARSSRARFPSPERARTSPRLRQARYWRTCAVGRRGRGRGPSARTSRSDVLERRGLGLRVRQPVEWGRKARANLLEPTRDGGRQVLDPGEIVRSRKPVGGGAHWRASSLSAQPGDRSDRGAGPPGPRIFPGASERMAASISHDRIIGPSPVDLQGAAPVVSLRATPRSRTLGT
jgi:hypothetical protein